MLARSASGVPGDAGRRPVYSHTVAVFFSAILGGGLFGAAAAWAGGPVTVGPEEQISAGNPLIDCTADNVSVQEQDGSVVYPSAEVEPSIDVNPTDSDNLIAVWQQDRWSDGGSRALFSAYSNDGGTTWSPVVLPGLTVCDGTGMFERASDPWVTFAPDGAADGIGRAVRRKGHPRIGGTFEHAGPIANGKSGQHDRTPSRAAVVAVGREQGARAAVGPAVLLPDGDEVIGIGRIDIDRGLDLGARENHRPVLLLDRHVVGRAVDQRIAGRDLLLRPDGHRTAGPCGRGAEQAAAEYRAKEYRNGMTVYRPTPCVAGNATR